MSLPPGPLLMNPDGLVSAFKREVIDKTPQKFKIACMLEVAILFPKNPFFSGFGNRTTDAVTYRSVGIELSKIFIINEKGEVIQLNNTYKKSYPLLSQILHELFPFRELNKEGISSRELIEIKEANHQA
jgi:phosphatidate phosphatase LPIN